MDKDGCPPLQRLIQKEHECCVVVSCTKPDGEGDMQVEMAYEGDPVLAAYLLQGALGHLEAPEDEMDPKLHCIE